MNSKPLFVAKRDGPWLLLLLTNWALAYPLYETGVGYWFAIPSALTVGILIYWKIARMKPETRHVGYHESRINNE